MNILKEIRDEIINDSISLSSILRKARVLASLLKHKEFEKWVQSELNGYKQDDPDLPEYRKLYAESVGDFSGPFQSGGRNMPIPTLNLPEYVQKFANDTAIIQGVKSIESLVAKGNSDTILVNWPADMIALCQSKIYQHMNLYAARKTLSKNQFEQILDTIRNKLLDFILELIEKNPSIDKEEKIDQIPTKQVESAFESHISGSYNSLNN